MGTRLYLFILLISGCLNSFSKNTESPIPPYHPILSSSMQINNLDSLIFDLASATITATYIDIPVYAKSDDVVTSMDYRFKFNLAKLTFSAGINLLPPDPNFTFLAYFNPGDLFLRYISSGVQPLPVNNTPIVYLTTIRFTLTTPCESILPTDFNTVTAWLNGLPCGYRFTTLDFSKYVPTASFTTGPTCSNADVQFTNTSTLSVGSITSTQWNFSNGVTSTLQNPSATYTAAGAGATTLIVTSNIGCKDTIVNPFNINLPPVSAFSYSFDCLKDTVFFTNSSTVPSGNIAISAWAFGDGIGTSNLTDPTYHYNTSGLFTTTLVSISNFSCSSTTTLVVVLNNKISASYTTSSVSNCVGSAISFSDATTYSISTINSWNWDFGDGNTSALQNPIHTYTTSGNYSVTLASTAADGCIGIITQILVINPLPIAAFGVNNVIGCAFGPINFNDLSTTAPGSSYLWHFGDNTTSTSQNPLHNYAAGGVYDIELIVTTPAGCLDSLTKTSYLTINSTPAVSFSTSSGCILTDIYFLNNTSIASGSISSTHWNFGDGNTSTLLNPTNSYTFAGSYTVSLISTSDLGCVDTYTQAIVLTGRPFVNFEYESDIGCSGEILSFSNLSISAPSPSYLWKFGDNTSSALQNPVHTFSVNGIYPIKLTVANPGGCSAFLIKSYTVSLPLTATALFTESVVANPVVSFSNVSVNSRAVSWDFGDAQNSILDNPSHTFPEIGTYKVCLTAYNSLNCETTACKDIFVGLSRIVAVPSGFTPNGDNNNDILKVRGGPFSEMQFQIFNEWDNLLFSSNVQDIGWDGTFKGELQPVGVYEYILNAKTLDNKNIKLYGVVNLIR